MGKGHIINNNKSFNSNTQKEKGAEFDTKETLVGVLSHCLLLSLQDYVFMIYQYLS
jgi:hypothetical protein